MDRQDRPTISYCGVFCELCPAYVRIGSCLGCGSEDHNQRRKSKWQCKIRNCCKERKIDWCSQCDEFPCSIRRRLDKNYLEKYDIDLEKMCSEMESKQIDNWIAEKKRKWKCTYCQGYIDPYEHTCYECGQLNK